MKKLLVIALSAMMVLAFAAVSMAAVEITGEVDAEYNAVNDTTMTELGLYCDAPINDFVSVYFGFWMDHNAGTDAMGYGILDDANATFKLGNSELLVGYGQYIPTILDVMGSYARFFDQWFGTFEPPVSVRLTSPIGEAFKVKVNYFRGQKTTDSSELVWDDANEDGIVDAGEMASETTPGSSRADWFGAGFNFEQDAFAVGFDYFSCSDKDVEAKFVLNFSYKLGEDGKVYAEYQDLGKDAMDDSQVFTWIGAQYTVFGKLTGEVEYAASIPTAWDDADLDNPVGYQITYKLDDNASLIYKRDSGATEVLTNSDLNKLFLVVTF